MFLKEDQLSQNVKKLLKSESKLRIAVAFIGDGASQWIGSQATDVQTICNLAMGGTNPSEVKTFINKYGRENVKHINNLHAKIYIGTEYAIVGSANFSANGLGGQPTGLREAGYKFKLDQPSGKNSLNWFEELWANAEYITDKDLKDAEQKWKRRSRSREGDWKADSGDICDYDFSRPDFPLISWYYNNDWDVSDELIEGKSDDEKEILTDQISFGVDIEDDIDITHLEAGRSIFHFRKNKTDELAAKSSNSSYTVCSLGIVIRGAYYPNNNVTNKIDVMLGNEKIPELFGLDKQAIYNEFRTLINSHVYRRLRCYDENEEPGWFNDRIELTRSFWRELQLILCATKSEKHKED